MDERSKVAIQSCGNYETGQVRTAVESLLSYLGGIEYFVKPGQVILLKPNLLSPRPPEQAVTTHPVLVATIAQLCLQAGAGAVWVGDSCAGDHDDEQLWEQTGMRNGLDHLPVVFKSFNQQVTVRAIGELQVPVPVWLAEVDLIISLPKLKTHALTMLTCGIKNMYGMISGQAKSVYHSSHPSPRRMSAFLARVFSEFKPDLTVVDAIVAMEGEGPANGRPKPVGLLMASTDAVAIDAVCAPFIKRRPLQLPLIAESARLRQGLADPALIDLIGITPEKLAAVRLRPSLARFLMRIPEPAFRLVARLLKCQPVIDQKTCVKCGICQSICSRQAISPDRDGRLRVDPSLCIVCMCCAESCPHHAVSARSPWSRLRRFVPLA